MDIRIVFGIIIALIIIIVFIVLILQIDAKEKPHFPVVLSDKNKRRYIKDVKPGEMVCIEWYRIKGGIGNLKCLSNDPQTKKILLQACWNNPTETGDKYEKLILDYNSDKLANFHLLNSIPYEDDNYNDIDSLQKKLNDAIKKENFELAEELKAKIDAILNKK